MLARICVEDSYNAAVSLMEPHGFEVDTSYRIVGMAWSDNLFTFGKSSILACTRMLAWASYLKKLYVVCF